MPAIECKQNQRAFGSPAAERCVALPTSLVLPARNIILHSASCATIIGYIGKVTLEGEIPYINDGRLCAHLALDLDPFFSSLGLVLAFPQFQSRHCHSSFRACSVCSAHQLRVHLAQELDPFRPTPFNVCRNVVNVLLVPFLNFLFCARIRVR